MRVWKHTHTFNHPWETVTTAVWRKYPNPINPSVLTIDVVEREVRNGILYSHRVLGSTWHIPKWVRSTIGLTEVHYASEVSYVDPRTKVMTFKSNNISLCSHLSLYEMLRYTKHPEDSRKTLLTYEEIVVVKGVPLSKTMEDMLMNKIISNTAKGREAIEWVIVNM